MEPPSKAATIFYNYTYSLSALSFAVSLAFFVTALSLHHWKHEINWCDMTYMYNYPQYIKVTMNPAVERLYPNYGLYIYGEGPYADRLKKGDLKGFPVLFIPGNAGSYRQVRSVASVAQMKTEIGRNPSELNFFTIDFDDELTGIYGGLLWRQTDFAAECVKRILDLYNGTAHSPNQVILIGHSMGGMIARALFLLPKFNSAWVTTIITLATPHVHPVAKFDWYLNEFYKLVNGFWALDVALNGPLSNVTLSSIGGGPRDGLVRSDLTRLSAIDRVIDQNLIRTFPAHARNSPGYAALHAHGAQLREIAMPLYWFENFAPSVSFVWATTDHLCIVWCNQLVRVVTRILFDINEWTPSNFGEEISAADQSESPAVEKSFDLEAVAINGSAGLRKVPKTVIRKGTVRAIDDPDARAAVFRYHLVSGAHLGPTSVRAVTVNSEIEMIMSNSREIRYFTGASLQIYFTSPKTLPTVVYKQFVSAEMVGKGVLLLTNQEVDAFVFRCSPDVGCSNVWPILNQQILPPNIRIVNLNFAPEDVGQTYIATTVYHKPKRLLLYRFYEPMFHRFEINLKQYLNIWSYITYDANRFFEGHGVFANITLVGMEKIWHSFRIRLRPLSCSRWQNEMIASMHYYVPHDPVQDIYRFVRYPYNSSDSVLVQWQMPPNFIPDERHFSNPVIRLYMNPGCNYTFEIQSEPIQAIRQTLRFFYPIVLILIPFHVLVQLFVVTKFGPTIMNSLLKVFPFQLAGLILPVISFALTVTVPTELDFVLICILVLFSFGAFLIGHFVCILMELDVFLSMCFCKVVIQFFYNRFSSSPSLSVSDAHASINNSVHTPTNSSNNTPTALNTTVEKSLKQSPLQTRQRKWKNGGAGGESVAAAALLSRPFSAAVAFQLLWHYGFLWFVPISVFAVVQIIAWFSCGYLAMLLFLPMWLYVSVTKIEENTRLMPSFGDKMFHVMCVLRSETVIMHLYFLVLFLCFPTLAVWSKNLRYSALLLNDPSAIPAALFTTMVLIPQPWKMGTYRHYFLLPFILYLPAMLDSKFTDIAANLAISAGLFMNVCQEFELFGSIFVPATAQQQKANAAAVNNNGGVKKTN